MDRLAVLLLSVLLAPEVYANVKLLSCHSVNRIPQGRQTEYVFISTKKEDCTFVFEGPLDAKLDMEVRSISFPKMFTEVENCRKSKLTIYNYIDSKVILGKLVCNENEKASLLTKSNMGIVTSSLTDGSFSIKIRPKPEDSDTEKVVAVMKPPNPAAEDFYFLERDRTPTNGGFTPIASGFRPSLPLHEKAKPFGGQAYHPDHPGFYPGRPTEIVDITYNATGHNFTIITHKPTTPEQATATQPEPLPTNKPAENSTITVQPVKPIAPGKPTTISQTTVAAQAGSSTEPLEEE
ncbi:uncharacterized protein [Halyomorpha halys]|uniref:uncharacterized protein n=1 Tax=Halyomorpha halys TaxID=286706 RepID=UPI0006D4F548|nr:uncharacterized protein LOC106686655 [Halyomorpha halys]